MRKISAVFLTVVVSSGLASTCLAAHTHDSIDVAAVRAELILPRIVNWLLASVNYQPDEGCVPSEAASSSSKKDGSSEVDDCGIQDPQ